MLCLPAGQVTTCLSQSTSKLPLSKPAPARACQLGSSATGPTYGHAVRARAVDQDLGVGVALVDQVLTREQIALLLRLMHLVDHVVVWCRRRRRLDVDDQMRPVLIAGRGEVHLVTHPFHLTLGAVPRLRVTRLWPR